MKGDEFRAALERLEMKQTGACGAEEFFGVDNRTVRRWIKHGPPQAVGMLLQVMFRLRVKPATVRRLFEEA